jgi:hypothetical protein
VGISLADLQSKIAMPGREFPFECELSLAPLVAYWKDAAAHESRRLARSLLPDLADAPELSEPIRDGSVLSRRRPLIDALMSAVFPPVFWEHEHAAALVPFQLRSFYATPSFERDLMAADGRLQGRLNVDAETLGRFRLLNAYALVLGRVYGIAVPVEYPLVFTVQDPKTGLDRHFKIHFEGRFVDVQQVTPLPPLPEEVRRRLSSQAADPGILADLIPPGSVRFVGFTVFKGLDVTDQEVLSSLKRDLIDKESIVSTTRFEGLQAKLRTLFRRPDLHFGLAAFEGERVLMLSNGAQFKNACIFADSIHHRLSDFDGTVFQRAGVGGEPLFIEDLAAYPDRTRLEDAILEHDVRSMIVAPLHYQEQLIGTLTVKSPHPGDLTPLLAPKLREVLPLFSVAVKRSLDELHSRVQAFIKEKCTAIHPVVEWRFQKAVLHSVEHSLAEGVGSLSEMEPIVFPDVHPLYAVSDIRGSSTQRAWAIQADLVAQLGLARDVLRAAHEARGLPILDQLASRIEALVAEIEVALRSGDEMAVISFLRADIEPLFDHLQGFGAKVRERVEAYRQAVDPQLGTVYVRRRAFEESVTLINDTISSYIDLEEQAAQSMFPHYFEKQKTDGVDYSIYVGASLLEDGAFGPLYLKNLRLWQLIVACGIAWRTARLRDQLAVPLEVTSLILVQHTPLAIRFRFDEKRFDVDGAYNVRYEIIKKRIDKAVVRGTTERLTQPGKIAIVYSHSSEAAEWRDYVQYLQRLGHLTPEVEELELEALQGAQGLRALRVTVDLAHPALDAPSAVAGLPTHAH